MPEKKADVQRETILVVEDDGFTRELVRMFLENEGYSVVTADDGEEGLLIYERLRPGIALLLTDVRMPGMSGVDLVERVLQINSHLPVLFMSGDATRLKLRSACLEKPFNSEKLVGTIALLLEASNRGLQLDQPC